MADSTKSRMDAVNKRYGKTLGASKGNTVKPTVKTSIKPKGTSGIKAKVKVKF